MAMTRLKKLRHGVAGALARDSLPNTGIPRRVWPRVCLSDRNPLLRLQLRQRRLQSLELFEATENLTSRFWTGRACMTCP